MDIRFSCNACGHRMIIDEAGAGMVVACAECGRDVKVPKAMPPPPNPPADTNSQPEKNKTVAIKWTPPPVTPHVEPKK